MHRGAYIQTATEFLPVVVFFVAGQLTSFKVATVCLLIATTISLATSWWQLRQVPFLPLFSGSIVCLFGGLSLLLQNPDYLIFADTFYFFVLALLIAAGFWQRKHFLERMFDQTFAMYDIGWRILSYRWITLLLIAGVANELVRYLATPELWIDYRFVKILVIVGFSFYQFRLSAKYRIPAESNTLGLRTTPPVRSSN